LLVLVVLLVAGCQPARPELRDPDRGRVLRIGILGELGHVPLVVMQKRQLLEQRVPGLLVEWKAIPNQEDVYEAVAGGGLDIAAGTTTAFLLARERGLPVRILAGVSEVPMAIVTNRSGLRSLADLRWGDRVAIPAQGGHEHVLLRLAALRELGDWAALDALVAPQPEAATSLDGLARGEVAAQVVSSPMLEQALARRGVRRLVDLGEVTGGPLTSVVVYSTPAARERQATLYRTFQEELRRAVDVVMQEPAEGGRLVAEISGRDDAGESLRQALAQSGLRFGTDVRGLERLARFMRHTGQLTLAPTTWADLAFDDARGS
jgi:NitT/TauT family transport system substrate-binding protein